VISTSSSTVASLSALHNRRQNARPLNENKSLIYFARTACQWHRDKPASASLPRSTPPSAAGVSSRSFLPLTPGGRRCPRRPPWSAPQGSARPAIPHLLVRVAPQAYQHFPQSQDTFMPSPSTRAAKQLFDNNDLNAGHCAAQESVPTITWFASIQPQIRPGQKPALPQGEDFRSTRMPPPSAMTAGYYADRNSPLLQPLTRTHLRRAHARRSHHRGGAPYLSSAMENSITSSSTRLNILWPSIVRFHPARELALANAGLRHTLIDFVGRLKTWSSAPPFPMCDDNVHIKGLTDANAAGLARRRSNTITGSLPPGKYNDQVLARDDENGQDRTYQTTFVIPP